MSMDTSLQAHRNFVASGNWFKMSLIQQLANIGTDVDRAILWRQAGKLEDSKYALWRALDLIWLTVEDPKNRKTRNRLKEILRMREVLLDYFMGDNEYKSTDALWQSYFHSYCYAAALERGR